MDDDLKQKLLKKELKLLLDDFLGECSPELKLEIDSWIKKLPTLSHIHQHSYTLFNLKEGRIIAHQSAKKSMLNKVEISAGALCKENHLLNSTHPSDRNYILKLEVAVLRFLLLLNGTQLKNFRLAYQRRIMINSTDYQCKIHKISIILSDENGQPVLLLFETEPCLVEKGDKDERFQIFSIHNKSNFKLFKSCWEGTMTHLTPTEIKVLYYIDKGYNKPEIAEMLKVVVSTIRKHCDNAKAKLHVSVRRQLNRIKLRLNLIRHLQNRLKVQQLSLKLRLLHLRYLLIQHQLR